MSTTTTESETERIARRRAFAAALKAKQGVKSLNDLDQLAELWPGTAQDGDPLEFILRERAERRRKARADNAKED